MKRKRLMSRVQERLLRSMLAEPERERYGLELSKSVDRPSGTLYPMLARLEKIGWIESRWEADRPTGRPPRRLYRLTPRGIERATEELEALNA